MKLKTAELLLIAAWVVGGGIYLTFIGGILTLMALGIRWLWLNS